MDGWMEDKKIRETGIDVVFAYRYSICEQFIYP